MNNLIFCNLSNFRKFFGYSQSDLAKFLNVSVNSISSWELNTFSPSLDNIVLLSSLFRAPIHFFIDFESLSFEIFEIILSDYYDFLNQKSVVSFDPLYFYSYRLSYLKFLICPTIEEESANFVFSISDCPFDCLSHSLVFGKVDGSEL